LTEVRAYRYPSPLILDLASAPASEMSESWYCLASDWLKTIILEGGRSDSSSTWVLATINLSLSCWGVYLARTLLSPDPSQDLPELTERASPDSGKRRKSSSSSSLDSSFMLHVDAFFGITVFLLSALLNFASVYLHASHGTGSTYTTQSQSQEGTWSSMMMIMYSSSPLQLIYIASGMVNVVGLVTIYQWWKKERHSFDYRVCTGRVEDRTWMGAVDICRSMWEKKRGYISSSNQAVVGTSRDDAKEELKSLTGVNDDVDRQTHWIRNWIRRSESCRREELLA